MENVVNSNILTFRPFYPWCFGWWPAHTCLPVFLSAQKLAFVFDPWKEEFVFCRLAVSDRSEVKVTRLELLGVFFSGDTFCWRGFRDSELNFDPWRSPVPLSVHLSVLWLFFIIFPSVTVHCFQTSLNCCVPLSYTLEFVASIFSFNSRASVCAVTKKNMSLKVCWGLIKGIWTLRLVLFVQTFSRRVFFGCFWTALAPSTPPHQCLHRSVSSFWDMMRRISEPLTPFFLHFWKKPSNSCLTHASAVCISHQCLHFSVSTGVMCIIWVAWQSPVCACSLRRQTQTTQFLKPTATEILTTAASFQSCQKVSAVSYKVF